MAEASKSGRQGTVRRAAETVLDVAIGGPALAADKAVEVLDKAVERGEEVVRTGARAARERAADATATARKAVSESEAHAYEERTRDELYRLAAERGIEGRGSMRKAELIAALRAAR